MKITKLNIGCGPKRKPGYTGVDCRIDKGVDFVAEAWDLSFLKEPVEAIYSRHMLEHLSRRNARKALTAWRAALTEGGKLEIIVPDLKFHCHQLLGHVTSFRSDRTSNIGHAMNSIYGWNSEKRGGDQDHHLWGYTEQSLTWLLRDIGFINPRRLRSGADSEPWHLKITAEK